MLTPNKNQEKLKNKTNGLADCQRELINNVCREIPDPDSLIAKVINYIINQVNFYGKNCRESRHTIAARLGCCLKTVTRATRVARRLGLFKRTRRMHTSNVYSEINPLLKESIVIEALANILPALRGLRCLKALFPLAFLLSTPSKASLENRLPEDVPQYLGEEVVIYQKATLHTLYTKECAPANKEVAVCYEGSPGSCSCCLSKKEQKPLNGNDMANEQRPNPTEVRRTVQNLQYALQNKQQATATKPVIVTKPVVCDSKYDDVHCVNELKEFISERLPRLLLSLKSCNYSPEKIMEVANNSLKSYTDRLTSRDIETLRSEGLI